MAGDKITIAIQQSNTFEEFADVLLSVEKKNMPNSIVSVDLDDEIFVEVKLNKSTMKESVTSTELLDSAIRVLKNVCGEDTVDIDNLKIYLNNVNRRANTVRLRVVKPLEKQ